MESFVEFAGAGLLGIALIVFWRMFIFVQKDRDYWRDKALDSATSLDETLDAAEKLVKPLKKVEKAMPKTKKTARSPSRIEQLEAVVEFLLQDRE